MSKFRIVGSLLRRPFLMHLLYKVEDGFDPVDPEYASRYASAEWQNCEQGDVASTIDAIEGRIGPLAGLRVLDLGGGGGQYTVGFALRGASVTWHDPSRAYMKVAQDHAQKIGVRCSWSLGYLEAASRLRDEPFDLVFCRVCWYYCASDAQFADLIIKLIRPGGVAWIYSNTADWQQKKRGSDSGFVTRILGAVYRHTGIKFLYFMPPRGLVSSLFLRRNCVSHLEVDY